MADDDDIPDALYDAEGDLQPRPLHHLPDRRVEVPDRKGVDLFLVHIDHDVINIPDKDGLFGIDGEFKQVGDLCSHRYPLKVYYYK